MAWPLFLRTMDETDKSCHFPFEHPVHYNATSEQCWARIRTSEWSRALFRLESFVFSFHDIAESLFLGMIDSFFLQGKKVEFNLELLGYSNHYRIVLISLILVDLFYFGIVLMNEWNGLFLISVHKGRFFSESMMHFSNCPINVQKPILNKILNCVLFYVSKKPAEIQNTKLRIERGIFFGNWKKYQ